MFSPRGAVPQRPRGPNPAGAKPPGSFQGGGTAGPQRKPAPGAAQGPSQRPPGQENLQWTGSQRINVRVTLHRADPRQVKAKNNLHQEQKGEVRAARWDSSPCPAPLPAPMPAPVPAPKPPAPARPPEQNASAQNRYTPESASSILASFGLSNEDLEELSRYPDEQLTPENMPLILREIRLRKMGHSLPALHPQSRGEEALSGTGGAAVKSKVIDYGHASKYGYTEDPLEVRAYSAEALSEEPLEARVYNPEPPGGEKREDGFQREQSVPMGVPPPGVPCSPAFPAQDVMKPPAFQSDSSNARPFFPTEPAGKAAGLCAAPVGKAVPPPAVPPVLPPLLPLSVPPLAQPSVPPVLPPLVTQPVVPLIPQPPFSAELLAILEQRDRIQREAGSSQPSAQSGSAAGQKPFPAQPEGPIKSPFGVVKASWLPVFLQADAQKIKRLPTPSMMNDYYATSPRIFPHMCSLCNIECTHMKDWILHQNTPSHIESCRQLRQQYPDWNPESRSSKRNAGDRKENQTPKRRSNSASPSPRRPRATGSSHVVRRSRSRSRSPGRYRPTRPRSRSPRPARRLSPRHRSRSPQRSRNPLRASPRPQRSSSNDWSSRRATRSQDRKAALEAVVKSLGPGFVAEFNKHKSFQAAGLGTSGSGKSAPCHGLVGKVSGNLKKALKGGASAKAAKKEVLPGSSSLSPESDGLPPDKEVEEDEEELPAGTSRPRSTSYNRLLREELLNCGTVLQISDLPDDGFSDQDIKKIVQPFGKVSDLIVLRSRNKAYLEMNYKEAVIAAVKYGETVPVLVNGKQVKISVAEKPKASAGQAKVGVKKKARVVKKVAPSTKKHQTTTTKATKTIAGKKEKMKKSVMTKEGKIKKTSSAAAKSVEKKSEDFQIPTETEMEGGEVEPSEPPSAAEGDGGGAAPARGAEAQSQGVNPAPSPEKHSQVPQVVAGSLGEPNEASLDQEAPAVPVESEESSELLSQGGLRGPEAVDADPDDTCVVLVSNLPEKGYSVEEVSNLAKPFGGLRDVVILSTHKKAYLEISRKSADSMVKFYTCFPMTLDGNQLCISMVPQHKTIKDEEAIFIALIKDADPKVNTETIRNHFVHLGNLPNYGYREFEVVCLGLRFGKVNHYVVLKNKNRAILQLESPKAARSMCCFLSRYSYRMGEHTLTCALSAHGACPEPEAVKKDVKKEEPSKGSSGLKKYPEGSGVVQTAAADPPVEPRVAKKEPVPNSAGKEETAAAKTELSELEGAPRAARKAGAELRAAPIGAAGTEPPEAEPGEGLPPSSTEKEEVVPGDAASELLEAAAGPASEKESGVGAEELPGELLAGAPGAGEAEAVPSGPAARLVAAGRTPGAVPRAVPRGAGAAPAEVAPSAATRSSQRLDALERKRLCDAVKAGTQGTEKKAVLKAGVALGRNLEAAGAEGTADGAVPQAGSTGESPERLLGTAGAEKRPEKCVAKAGAPVENAENNTAAKKEGGWMEAPQSKGAGEAKAAEAPRAAASSSSLPAREPSAVCKMILKAVLSVPEVAKPRAALPRAEPAPCRAEEQKAPPRARPRGAAGAEKKTASRAAGQPRAGSGQPGPGAGRAAGSRACAPDGKGGGGRNSSQQEKDSQVESRASSRLSAEGESRACSGRKDAGSNKVAAGGHTRTSRGGGSSGAKQKEEEELFPFNLDEFVTVDEVVEESESPVRTRQNPPKGKRKEGAKSTSEPSSKRRKGKSSHGCLVESELSFVTLDEIGEEEEVGGAPGDPRGLVVVDEVLEEEELLPEAAKDPQALVTLDEISEQEELGSHKDPPGPGFEERDLKAEPLVTVDEIGEVEELPLTEPAGLSVEEVPKHREEEKGSAEDAGDFGSSQVPDDPSALVTVDEIQEDNEDAPLVTLDEVNEDEEDFLADFNRLKEELNFVTVDEVGEEDEEEENTLPGKILNRGEGDEDVVAVAGPEEEDIVAVAGPEEMEILGAASPEEEETTAVSKLKDHLGSGGKELELKVKQGPSSDARKAQSAPTDLDYLLPKAGFFCQICSLFYADETSVKNHCRTPLHQQNMEKFMAKQKESGGEEQGSR